jgi:hypothetical protein
MRTIRIIAFEGTGPKYAGFLDPTDSPLLITGHVGLQPESARIYGLHPPDWAIFEEGGPEEASERLRGRRGQPKDMPGTIHDDTDVFHLAYRRSLNRPPRLGNRLVVYFMNYSCNDDTFEEIHSQLIEWYTQSTVLRYGWPPIEEQTPFDNCATVQRLLGMEIVNFEWHQGRMAEYMRIFRTIGELWNPND